MGSRPLATPTCTGCPHTSLCFVFCFFSGPNAVLIFSLGFIVSVVLLHVLGKLRS